MKSKLALVLEGGGLRGIFTAGVIDCFIDNDIDFDYVIGVSAGSCNAFAYIAKARSFIKKSMMQEDKRNAFYGVQQMVKSHKYVDLDKVFYDYTKQYDFDFDKFKNSKCNWEFVATNVNTGKPEYMHSDDVEMAKQMGRASCSLPAITEPVEINGQLYLDGGISDSVPIERAMSKGYDKIVVVATRKQGSYSRINKPQLALFSKIYEKYPKFIETLEVRSAMYKRQIKKCERLEQEGKVILIRPTLPEVGRLESDMDELSLSYFHGYTKAKEYIDQIKNW